MFSSEEFEVAFEKARDNHPSISKALGESVIKKFMQRWESNQSKDKFQRQRFPELIRLTLNEMSVSGKANRKMYASLIGHYYNPHAVLVKAQRKKSGQVKQKPQTIKTPIGVTMGFNGQLSWNI